MVLTSQYRPNCGVSPAACWRRFHADGQSGTDRKHIIDAAARLFGERHYHQVLLDEIAAQAGVSKGTVYLHFKDKDDLYLAAMILHGIQRLVEQMQQTIRGLQSPEEKLLGIVSKMLSFCARRRIFES